MSSHGGGKFCYAAASWVWREAWREGRSLFGKWRSETKTVVICEC